MEIKKEVINFYDGLYKYYGTYHNHKELSAWAGLVFFLVFCAGVLKIPIVEKFAMGTFWLLAIGLIAVGTITFFYINNQLNAKDTGGHHVMGALLIINELLRDNSKEINLKYLSLEQSSDQKYQAPHVLPKYLSDLVNKYKGKGEKMVVATRIGIIALLSILGFFTGFVKYIETIEKLTI